MSAQLSARRALRSSRRDPAVVRQLRLDIDAELDPARPPSAPSAAAAAAPAAAAAVVGADRRALRSSRRDPAVVSQLRLDIDAELDPARPPPAPSAAAAAAVDGVGWLYDSDFGAHSDDSSDDDFMPQDVSMDTESDSELDYVSLHDSSLDSDEPLSNVHARYRRDNAPGKDPFKWLNRPAVPRKYGFDAVPGLQEGLLEPDATPRDVFELFFTPDLWTTMKDETNRYAFQHPRDTSSHMKAWEDVTEDELRTYIALRILMGINPKPEIRHYWSGNRYLGTPVFQEYLTRDRFDLITSNLHFTDNDDVRRGEDRLWKVRPVVDCLQRQFAAVYTPDQEVSVDESLFRYKGRHHAIQYCPAKRGRFGLKVYKLSSSSGPMAGYTSAFKVYMGQDRSDIPASMKAVIDLMDAASLFDKGYICYTDNWYSSPTLFHHLQGRRTYAVGTVRPTRKWMPRPQLQVRRKGDVAIRSSPTGQLALAWMDKKQVNMLSTFHRGRETVTLPPNHRGEERIKPLVVHDYNRGMKGVDLSDQMASSYETPRKCKKWYHNLFFHLVDMALVNAHLVYQHIGGRKAQLDFRLELVDQYLKNPLPPRPQRRATPLPRPVPVGHHLVSIPNYRRCKQCKITQNKRKEIRYACSECDVGLCPGDCFNSYHQA